MATDGKIFGAHPLLWVVLVLVLAGGGAFTVKKLGDSAKIDSLHPQLQPLVRKWLDRMSAKGVSVKITAAYRSLETQRKLAAEGKSKVTAGFHNYGLAFDFVPTGKLGQATYPKSPPDKQDPTEKHIFDALRVGGEEGKKLGMKWGGDWGWDWFHLEWHPELTLTQVQARIHDPTWRVV